MRVALIGPFPPYRGGIAQFTGILADTMENLGHEVLRISFSRLYPAILFPGTSQFEPEPDCPYPAARRVIDSCWPPSWRTARKLIEQSPPDLVVAKWWHPYFAPALTGVIPRRLCERGVLVCHNVLPHERFPFAVTLLRRLLRRVSGVVVHSEEDAARAREITPDVNVRKLHFPVYSQYDNPDITKDSARRQLGLRPDSTVALYFGLIRSYKGVPDAIEAIEGMRDSKIELLVVGESYSGGGELRERMRRSPIASRMHRVDRFVRSDEVALFFKAADMVVLPYRHATQSAVAPVALAFRKPLVMTRTGGLAELVDEGSTGFLAQPGNPTDLRRAIESCLELVTDPGLEDRIAEFSRRFDWPSYVKALLETGGVAE
jgi:glycosyltransferase involved in cell wall biosynthesis